MFYHEATLVVTTYWNIAEYSSAEQQVAAFNESWFNQQLRLRALAATGEMRKGFPVEWIRRMDGDRFFYHHFLLLVFASFFSFLYVWRGSPSITLRSPTAERLDTDLICGVRQEMNASAALLLFNAKNWNESFQSIDWRWMQP